MSKIDLQTILKNGISLVSQIVQIIAKLFNEITLKLISVILTRQAIKTMIITENHIKIVTVVIRMMIATI